MKIHRPDLVEFVEPMEERWMNSLRERVEALDPTFSGGYGAAISDVLDLIPEGAVLVTRDSLAEALYPLFDGPENVRLSTITWWDYRNGGGKVEMSPETLADNVLALVRGGLPGGSPTHD